jgi:hypothetical protein
MLKSYVHLLFPVTTTAHLVALQVVTSAPVFTGSRLALNDFLCSSDFLKENFLLLSRGDEILYLWEVRELNELAGSLVLTPSGCGGSVLGLDIFLISTGKRDFIQVFLQVYFFHFPICQRSSGTCNSP